MLPFKFRPTVLPTLPTLILAAITAAWVGPVAPATAQLEGDTTENSLALEPEAFVSDALQMSLNLPLGALVVPPEGGGPANWMIHSAPDAPSWSLRLDAVASQPGVGVADQIVNLVLEQRIENPSGHVLDARDVVYDGQEGRICLIEQTLDDGRKVVLGWILVDRGDGTFLALTIFTTPDDWQAAVAVLDRSLQTMSRRQAIEASLSRGNALQAGADLLKAITPERLRSLVGLEEVRRIYMPATNTDGSDEKEVGWASMAVRAGQRGEMEPSRDPADYNEAEKKEGIIVEMSARLVTNAERGVFYDTVSTFWMAWDQSEEAWSSRGTHRQGDAVRSEAETGVRPQTTVAQRQPQLTVIKFDRQLNLNEPFVWTLPEPYLSRPLYWLMPQLLPRESGTGTFAWATYDLTSREPKISMRIDDWQPLSDGTGRWRLDTRIGEGSPSVTSIYTADGVFIEQTQPDGTRIVPTTTEQVKAIWKAKGLLQ